MRYIWEEDDIYQGCSAQFENGYTVTVVYDPFPAAGQEHRPWRLLEVKDSRLSPPYSKTELCDIFTRNNYVPVQL
jgi:hypothetical protein